MNKNKIITLVIGVAVIVLGLGTYAGLWIQAHNFDWTSPVKFQKPLDISKKQLVINTTQIVQAAVNNSPLTEDQQYACNKFGKDCAVAIAIMRAESHYRSAAINVNSNGSVDFGCWQINSIHLKQIDTTKVNLLNCKDSTDIAFQIYSQQKGFGAWVAYNSGVYKNYLLK